MSTITEDRQYWLAWSQIAGVGPILLQRLQEHFGNLENAWKSSPGELGKIEGVGFHILQKIVQYRGKINPEKLLIEHEKINPHFWTPADVEYPKLLREISTPPPILYYRGQLDLEENRGEKPLVGIVGTRKPTKYGRKWTRHISTVLAQNGFTIVSGMADGIDAESHSAAIQAGGRTIAVVGTGVDVIYPYSNKDLYKEILKSGIVISEHPTKTSPHRTHFPRRNRIIAGLSRVVLVMEAGNKSGALITATYANEFSRDIYALPGRVDDELSQGCLKLISQGAGLISQELNELLTMLGAIPKIHIDTPAVKSDPFLGNLEPELQQVMSILTVDALPFDLIVEKAKMGSGLVSGYLLQLELMGLVSQLPGMRYQKSY